MNGGFVDMMWCIHLRILVRIDSHNRKKNTPFPQFYYRLNAFYNSTIRTKSSCSSENYMLETKNLICHVDYVKVSNFLGNFLMRLCALIPCM